MTSLLTKRQLGDLGQLFKDILVRILTLPFLMVLGMAVLLALVVGLAGGPVEIVLNFALEATSAVAVFQFKLLVMVGSIGALCFAVGAYRLDVLASYVAEKLKSKIRVLQLLWSSMLSGVRTQLRLPTVRAVLVPA